MRKLLVLLIGVVFIGQGCFRNDDCHDCYNGPALFGFTLLPTTLAIDANAQSLIPSIYKLDTIKLFYFDGDVKKDIIFGNGLSHYLGMYLVSTDISVISAGKNIKTFYLYLNQFDTDTIYFDSKLENDGCCTSYRYDSISYNGKKMLLDANSHLQYAIKPQPIVP